MNYVMRIRRTVRRHEFKPGDIITSEQIGSIRDERYWASRQWIVPIEQQAEDRADTLVSARRPGRPRKQ